MDTRFKALSNETRRKILLLLAEGPMAAGKFLKAWFYGCPDGGTLGGGVVFTGTPQDLAEHGQTITADYLRKR